VSDPFLWAAVLSALCGAYLSILQMSLAEFSRNEVETLLGNSRRQGLVAWVAEKDDELILAAAVLRRFLSVTLLICVLLFISRAEGGAPTAFSMIIAAVSVLLWLYLTEIGIGSAVAEHSASSIVKSAIWMLPAFHLLTRPLTAPLLVLNEVVRRLVGAEERDDLEEDIRQVVEESEREGTISEIERDMFERIVDFRTATAEEVMTPRIDVLAIRQTDDLEEIKAFVIEAGHSRFPVYEETVDRIIGVLHVKDLLPFLGRDPKEFQLEKVLRSAPFVPESHRISELLAKFQQKNTQMAIVLDEYGGTAGVVTIEDILEEIVGEIRDEHERIDVEEPAIVPDGNGCVEVDARVHIDDLNDEIGSNLPEDADFDTVGGWVFSSLGRIPQTGEQFEIGDFEVEVLDAEPNHVGKVRLRLKNGREKAAPVDLDGLAAEA